VRGRFWASDSDSETDEEVDLTVDSLAASMSNLSLTLPIRSPGLVTQTSLLIQVSEPTVVRAMDNKVHYVSSISSSSTTGHRIEFRPPRQTKMMGRLWEGLLPALRVSPKWCLGDTMQMAKVNPSRPSSTYGGYDASRCSQPGWQPLVEKPRWHVGSEVSGKVRGSSNFKSSVGCTQIDSWAGRFLV
jgi:hypothetical protein